MSLLNMQNASDDEAAEAEPLKLYFRLHFLVSGFTLLFQPSPHLLADNPDNPQSSLVHTVNSEQCTVNSVQCTVYSVQWTVHSKQCTVNNAQCTLNSEQCTVNSA